MAYRIVLKPSVQKDLDAFQDSEIIRIVQKLEQLQHNPRPFGVQKLKGSDAYRLRSGSYRILFEIDDTRRTILVFRVKHRREIYRK